MEFEIRAASRVPGFSPGAVVGGAVIVLVVGGRCCSIRTGTRSTCRSGRLIGPLVMITLGALMLLNTGAVRRPWAGARPDG